MNILLGLLNNAALLLAAMALLDILTGGARPESRSSRVTTGVLMGAVGCALMLTPWPLLPGVVFDTRSVLLSVTGLFLGALPAAIAMLITSLLRLYQGGAGAVTGVLVIVTTAGLGVVWRRWRGGIHPLPGGIELYGFGIVVHVAMLLCLLTLPLPGSGALTVLERISLPVLLIYPVATVCLGLLFALHQRRQGITAALSQSEARFRAVARLSSDFAYSCIHTGVNGYQVDWITDAFFTLSGFSEAELHQHGCWMFIVHPDDQALADEPLKQLRAGETDRREFRVVTRTGEVLWLSNYVQCQAEPAAPGGLRLLGAAQNTTERKQAEDEIRRLNAELEERVHQRTAQLEAANQELESFSYAVSHDLKAPLRAIDGYSRLLQEDCAQQLDAQGRQLLDQVCQSAQRMNELIEHLLTYARMEQQVLRGAAVDIVRLMQTVLTERAGDREASGVELWGAFPPLRVWADPDGLAMVLRNLLENALKFSRAAQPPVIEIGGRVVGENVVLWIRDNGIGFDMKFHDRIFELFQRLQRAEDYPGTGVGLALVRRAMRRMGGKVWAESAPGQGATFYLELPVQGPATVEPRTSNRESAER